MGAIIINAITSVVEHYQEGINLFSEKNVLGNFLFGSQNYGLSDDKSDVDTKLLIAPTSDEIIFNNKPRNFTHTRINNEHIDVIDIRLFLQHCRRQHFNFIETLFTPYYITTDKYDDIFDYLKQNNEKIAHYDEPAALECLCGAIYRSINDAIISDQPINPEYNGKMFATALRLYDLANKYTHNYKYNDCLKSDRAELIIQIKRNELSFNDIILLRQDLLNNFSKINNNYYSTHKIECNKQTEIIINDIQKTFMERIMKGFFVKDE